MSQSRVQSEVMVALDYETKQEALQLLRSLAEMKPYVKVGMQLFYAEGPALIHLLKEMGFSIFLDLKLHDIPNTVKGAAHSIAKLGVDMFNVHCAGGSKMMEAALEGLDQAHSSTTKKPLVIGVTQLTSTSQRMMQQEIGISGKLEDTILHYGKLAQGAGLDGVVCSPLEVKMIKSNLGQPFLTVTPGIRPKTASVDDQIRITTPYDAAKLGTDYMVIGRAITKAVDPAQAYQDIRQEIERSSVEHG